MIRARRWAGFVGLGMLILALSTGRGAGQVQPPVPASGTCAAMISSVKIFEDSKRRKAIEVGSDFIADKEWSKAAVVLQAVLKEKEDYYVSISETDPNDVKKTNTRWSSVKFAANSLIGSMPTDGLEAYEVAYGADAKILLDEAKKNGDVELLNQVALTFCHTKSGIQANEIKATLYLARGQVFAAALQFEKLLAMNPAWAKPSDLTLFKAAVAFHRAGDKKSYEETWKRLESLPGVQVGEEVIPIAKLETVIKETPIADVVNVYDWPSVRGNNSNTAQAMGSPPLMDRPLWRRPLLNDKLEGFDDADADNDQLAQQRINSAIKHARDGNVPVLSGFFPIASRGIMVYRSYRDVRAVALADREDRDEVTGNVYKTKAGEILWKAITHKGSLADLLTSPHRAKTENWLADYEKAAEKSVPGFNSFLYDNTLLGSIATDHRYVYAINDLAVPPHPSAFVQQFGFNPQMQNFGLGDLKTLVMQNELYAYDLVKGSIIWDLNQEDEQFKYSHFL